MATHPYWRINVSANNASTNTSIGEIEMRATVSGADQCTGGTATDSGNIGGGYVAANCFDNNSATMWNTGGVGWVRYQFASAVDVLEYTIASRSDGFTNDAPKDFTLEYSDDGTSWTVADTRTSQTGWSAGQIRTFAVGAATPTYAQVTQVAAETWATDPAAAQLTQVAVEEWTTEGSTIDAQLTQTAVEMWSTVGTVTGYALLTQIAVEMWAPSTAAVAAAGRTKVWNGTSWAVKPVKVWNGSAWV